MSITRDYAVRSFPESKKLVVRATRNCRTTSSHIYTSMNTPTNSNHTTLLTPRAQQFSNAQAWMIHVLRVLSLLAMCVVVSHAQGDPVSSINEGRICGSPRFLVKTGDSNAFTLKSTTVTAQIIGVIADVHVRQVYFNNGSTPVEATYMFPASTRAAVYGMTMKVQDRVINAVIKEKEVARQTYRAAVNSGRAATLLEQIRPNVFNMSVGNIVAHDSIVVDLHYTEAVDYSNGVYEFVYPAVVGPRYASNATPKEYDQILSSRDIPKEIPGLFNISVTVAAGMPVKAVESPSHTIDVTSLDPILQTVATTEAPHNLTRIEPKPDQHAGNRDLVVQYRLSGRALESGLLLSKGTDENFFMLMIQPPRTVDVPHIIPREYVFIVDVSGSMWGQPLEIANQLMSDLLDKLRPEDKFNILMFSGGSQFLAENSLPITHETRERAKRFLNSGYGNGGTELLPALKRALAMKEQPGMSRNFVIVTDGYVQCEREAFSLVRSSLGHANFYAFGIGGGVNRYLMEGLARAGNADPMIVTNMAEAPTMAKKFREYIEAPVMTGITVDYGGMDVYDVFPASIPDVTSKRPIVVYGKWRGDASGTLRIKGSTTTGAYNFSVNLAATPERPENGALRYLWARNLIRDIQDGSVNNYGYAAQPSTQEVKRITDLGLRYNLLTDYTSFIAVDSVISVQKTTTSDVPSTPPSPEKNESGTFSPAIQQNIGGPGMPNLSLKKSNTTFSNTLKSLDQPPPAGNKQPVTTNSGLASGTTGRAKQQSVERSTVRKQAHPSSNSRASGTTPQDRAELSTEPKNTQGGISIRGGRSGDIKVLNDGIETSDAVTADSGLSANQRGGSISNTANQSANQTANTGRSASSNNASTSEQPRGDTARLSNNASIEDMRGSQPGLTRSNSGVDNSATTSSTLRSQSTIPSSAPEPQSGRGAQSNTNISEVQVVSISTEDDTSPLMAGRAPSGLFMGPYIGLTFNSHNRVAVQSYPSGISSIPDGTASGSSWEIGWTTEQVLGNVLQSSSALRFDVTVMSLRDEFKGTSVVTAFNKEDFSTMQTTADFLMINKLTTLHLGLLYEYNIGRSPLGIYAGPSVDFVLASDADYTATLRPTTDPVLVRYTWYRLIDSTVMPTDQEGSRVILNSGSAPDLKRVRVGLTFGLRYEIRLRRMLIVPQVQFDLGLTKTYGNQSLMPIKVGVAFKFAM